jgi:hypothetical protein
VRSWRVPMSRRITRNIRGFEPASSDTFDPRHPKLSSHCVSLMPPQAFDFFRSSSQHRGIAPALPISKARRREVRMLRAAPHAVSIDASHPLAESSRKWIRPALACLCRMRPWRQVSRLTNPLGPLASHSGSNPMPVFDFAHRQSDAALSPSTSR